MADPQRTFIVRGERLIDCSRHCPPPFQYNQPEYLGGLQQVEGVKAENGATYVPVCLAANAPLQNEVVGGPSRQDRGVQFSRACVHHAQRLDTTLIVNG